MRKLTLPSLLVTCALVSGCGPAFVPAGMQPAATPSAAALANAAAAAASAPVIPGPPATTFIGAASFGGPLAGATVALVDADDKPIGGALTTNSRGGFIVPAAGLPKAFTVIVRGGQVGHRPFESELRAVVRNLDANSNFVAVGVPSTLAAHALRVTPAADPAQLTSAAERALGLNPNAPDLGELKWLNGPAIVADAAAAGGWPAWYAARVGDLAAGRPFPATYRAGGGNRSEVASSLASELGEKFLEGGIEKIGEQLGDIAVGSILDAVGLDVGQAPSVDRVHEALLQVQTQLNVFETSLTTDLAKVQSQVAYSRYIVAKGPLQAVLDQQDPLITDLLALTAAYPGQTVPAPYQFCTIKSMTMFGPIEDCVTVTPTAAPVPPAVLTEMATTRDRIRDQFVSLRPLARWRRALEAPLDPTVGTLGVRYSQAVRDAAPLGRMWGADQARAIEGWWDAIDAELAGTVLLLVEYYRATKDTAGLQATLTEWQEIRQGALAKLRGTLRTQDVMNYGVTGKTNVVTRLTNTIPPNSVVNGKQGTFYLLYRPLADDTHLGGAIDDVITATGQAGWKIPTRDDVLALTGSATGAQLQSVLGNAGMRSWPGVALWVDNTYVQTFEQCGGKCNQYVTYHYWLDWNMDLRSRDDALKNQYRPVVLVFNPTAPDVAW